VKRRAFVVAAVLAASLGLAGCDTRKECEARGGKWRSHTVTETSRVNGKVQQRTRHVWSCVEKRNR
jgi:outer membrane murein-binding lipoprotein Lpp